MLCGKYKSGRKIQAKKESYITQARNRIGDVAELSAFQAKASEEIDKFRMEGPRIAVSTVIARGISALRVLDGRDPTTSAHLAKKFVKSQFSQLEGLDHARKYTDRRFLHALENIVQTASCLDEDTWTEIKQTFGGIPGGESQWSTAEKRLWNLYENFKSSSLEELGESVDDSITRSETEGLIAQAAVAINQILMCMPGDHVDKSDAGVLKDYQLTDCK